MKDMQIDYNLDLYQNTTNTSLVEAMRILALVLLASPSMLTVPTVFV